MKQIAIECPDCKIKTVSYELDLFSNLTYEVIQWTCVACGLTTVKELWTESKEETTSAS